MDKSNVFKSSNFFMSEGDILHMIFLDEQGVPVTVDLQTTPAPGEIINVVPGQAVAKAATAITSSSFTANWNLMENATGYYFDVHTDPLFPDDDPSAPFVVDNHDAGNDTSHSVTGLDPNYTYYYRVRAYNDIGTGINSEIITLTTLVLIASDWFLFSEDELEAFYQFYLINPDPFVNVVYGSSTEASATMYRVIDFATGIHSSIDKSTPARILPIRSFIGSGFSVGDYGQAGGLVFYIDGTTCYEIILSIATRQFSDVVTLAIGTTDTAIGTGQANTTAIINQVGHIDTDIAAEFCNNFIT